MGLDITAYRKVVKETDVPLTEDGDPVNWGKYRKAWVNPAFPGREGSIENGAIYSHEEAFGFRAGGYGWFGEWREMLAKIAGYPAAEAETHRGVQILHAASCWNGATGPFSELINFADNEGILGPEVSKKLLADFIAFEDQARASEDPDFVESYLEWKHAFELAADGGMVDFH